MVTGRHLLFEATVKNVVGHVSYEIPFPGCGDMPLPMSEGDDGTPGLFDVVDPAYVCLSRTPSDTWGVDSCG